MSWILLLIASVFEVAWTIGLKLSAGFTKPGISAVTVLGMAVSMLLLGLATKNIPIGTAYAVWTGIGAVGAVLSGALVFGEELGALRIGFISLIIAGIVGLKLSS